MHNVDSHGTGRTSWLEERVGALLDLKGRSLARATVYEMALIELDEHGMPVFEHPACPFVQAHVVYLHFADHETAKIYSVAYDNS